MNNFWEKLPKPFLALAPMEDVTDSVLRQIIVSVGAPHLMFTEFVNVDGIVNLCDSDCEKILFRSTPPTVPSKIISSRPASPGREEFKKNGLLQRLYFTEGERPLVAQIWGSNPENFYKAAQIIKNLGFDGVDINIGCPQRKVMKTGGCAALIGQNDLVKEIIQATKEGAGGLPVSIKTRIGIKKIITEDWIGFLLEQSLAAITVHGRTAAEQSKVEAHWEEIGKAVKLRDKLFDEEIATRNTKMGARLPGRCRRPAARPFFGIPVRHDVGVGKTLIIGNGDVKDYQEAMQKVEQYGVDGVMIGRGIFQKPTAFVKQDSGFKIKDNINLFKKHINLYSETWGEKKSFYILRKFVKMYINGWEGAAKMREEFMKAESYEELEHNIQACQKHFQ